jgi:hypothetical protein
MSYLIDFAARVKKISFRPSFYFVDGLQHDAMSFYSSEILLEIAFNYVSTDEGFLGPGIVSDRRENM